MPEYCWVVSQKPSTGADEWRVIEEEKNICESLLQEAFENRKTEFLKDMIQKYFSSQEQNDGIEVVESVWQNGVIIDIRDEQEVKRFPLVVWKGVEVLCIPFFEVKHKFGELDASKNYFLYCGKWMMSRLYALYLKERGYENIGIFQRKRW
jgi:thiamine biosynthesis protein ThiI